MSTRRRREWTSMQGGGWQNVAAPAGAGSAFDYVPFTIQKSGFTFRPDPTFDLRTHSGIDPDGKAYYVDPVDGSDGGDGLSWATAYKRVQSAYNQADAVNIYIKPGVYEWYQWIGSLTPNIDKAVICVGPGQAILTPRVSVSFSAVGSHYEGSTTNDIQAVVDISRTDADGSYEQLTEAALSGDVDTTPGSWFYDPVGDVLYVRLSDDRAPDSDVYPCNNQPALSLGQGNRTVYWEKCTFLFGTNRHVRLNGNGNTFNAYFKDCVFGQVADTTDREIVDIDGLAEVIFQDCIAEYGPLDGFNYHVLSSVVPNVIEIDCEARYCGVSGATENGSSHHDGGKVVRLNGKYHDTWGTPVADVGGVKSWNLGVESYNSLTATLTRKNGFLVANGEVEPTEMWLDNCWSHDNEHDMYAEVETIYYRNLRGPGVQETASGGTITTY